MRPGATTKRDKLSIALLSNSPVSRRCGWWSRRSRFVEFETDAQASVAALSGLQGFKINPTHSMTLAFAAK